MPKISQIYEMPCQAKVRILQKITLKVSKTRGKCGLHLSLSWTRVWQHVFAVSHCIMIACQAIPDNLEILSCMPSNCKLFAITQHHGKDISSNIELMLRNQLVVSPRMQMNSVDCCQLWQWTTLPDCFRNCLVALQTRWQQPKSIVFYLDVVGHHLLCLNSLTSVLVLRCWGNFPNFLRETMHQGHPRVGALLWMGKKLPSITGKTVLKNL